MRFRSAWHVFTGSADHPLLLREVYSHPRNWACSICGGHMSQGPSETYSHLCPGERTRELFLEYSLRRQVTAVALAFWRSRPKLVDRWM